MCVTCGICFACLAFGAYVFSCAVCLAAWLAITTAVVFTTARAILQSVLRRSKHDSCCRAIVAAATCSLCEGVRMCIDVVGRLIVSACLSRLHPYYPAGQLCLGRGPVVQKGIRQFGFGSAVCWIRLLDIVVPCAAYTAYLQSELERDA